jgi:hypothetical protein
MSNIDGTTMSDLRIGDSEREAAAKRLADHAAAGRLDVDELEKRLELVNAATYAGELAVVERDLPSLARPRRQLPAFPAVPLLLIACITFAVAVAVAGTIAIGHPIFPFFLVAFFLWRRRSSGYSLSRASRM